jgi:hypothetical protein
MSSSFINRDKVVKQLIKVRCKLADRKSKQDQHDEFINSYDLPRKVKKFNGLQQDIYGMFPPRRQWCHVGKERKRLDNISRNRIRLEHTYLKARHRNCNEGWYFRLCNYADSIVKMADETKGGIAKPKVTVIEKKRPRGKNIIECRPVCSFHLKLKIILSLLNKYLTSLFDSYFLKCSYAFRTLKTDQETMQHLNAVKSILAYRNQHLGETLYVAECDMQKFYDTINHNVIKSRFIILLNRAKRDGLISSDDAKAVKKWFFMYIDCFDFLSDINVYNKISDDNPFWNNIKNKGNLHCVIKWVDNKSIKRSRAKRNKGKVGVPQGGPLSGLVANIVMHSVDEAVLREIGEKDILFCRFCDDMILIGDNEQMLTKVLNTYKCAIRDSKLIAHPKEPLIKEGEGMKSFWKGKTKGPYPWGEKGKTVFPWITFVGFDINWKGNLRIRKSSFKRQIAKQNKVANSLVYPYLKGKRPRYCSDTIMASLVSRLIGMSVGRVNLWNYENNPNIRSWMSAFYILDENPWSTRQLKTLDRHRGIVIARTKKAISSMICTNKKKDDDYQNNQRNRFSHMGAPFSYYGQCFKYKTL